MCAAYCMRACVWLMPSIRTLFRFTLEWKLPMFVRVCSNTVSRTGTENHEPTRTMVKKKNTHTRARTHTPLLGYFTRIMVAITRGAFIGCSHIPASLSYSKKKKEKKLLFSILCFFFLILSFTAPVSLLLLFLQMRKLMREENTGLRLRNINISITRFARWKEINWSGFMPFALLNCIPLQHSLFPPIIPDQQELVQKVNDNPCRSREQSAGVPL